MNRYEPQSPEPPPDRPEFSGLGGERPAWQDPPRGGGGGPTREDVTEGDGGPSWEYRAELGWFSAAVKTVKEVLFEPGATFSRARRSGGLTAPLLFAFLMGTIFLVLTQLVNLATNSLFLGMLSRVSGGSDVDQIAGQMFGTALGTVLMLFFAPVFAIIGPFISAAIAHVCLMIFGGARRDFEATYRVVAYGYGSTLPLSLIPLCGGFVTWIWMIVIQIIGLKEIHGTDTWRAAMAVFLPMILGVCCCVGIGMLIFMGVASAGMAGATP